MKNSSPKRDASGHFAKGSLRGVTAEFAKCQTDQMRRFILADADRRATVSATMTKTETRDGLPHDDLRAAVLACIERPEVKPPEVERPVVKQNTSKLKAGESLLSRIVAWLFPRPPVTRKHEPLKPPAGPDTYDSSLVQCAFVESLPVEFPLCGYVVRIERRPNSQIAVAVSQSATERHYDQTGTRDEVRGFMAFYLRTPAALHAAAFQ